jgi:hypothetical protein
MRRRALQPRTDSARPYGRVLLGAQVAALAISVALSWHAFSLFYASRANFDSAMAWYALAVAALCFFAWDGRPLGLRRWPERAVSYIRAHPIELLALGAVAAIAILTRFYRYGVLPPSGFLILEEHINGGVAWEILQGDRPLNYALVRYSTALGMSLLGPTTDGIRLPFVVASLVVLFPFYLLMRELVDRPAALFATGLVAALRVFGDVTFHMQISVLASVLLAFMLIRGLKTANPIWFVFLGLMAAILSYEYESHKVVPLFAAAYLGFFAFREVARASIKGWVAVNEMVRPRLPQLLRIGIVIPVALFIGFGPMIGQEHRGERIYFGSIQRQQLDREGRGQATRFAPNARQQLEWAAQVFTPFVKPTYIGVGHTFKGEVIDKITSALLWIALLVGSVRLLAGHRGFFVLWFAGGMIGSALFLANFAPWKVIPFLVPGVILIGILVDDALVWLRQFYARTPVYSLALPFLGFLLLVVLAAGLRVLDANSKDIAVLREFDAAPSQLYAVCDYLRSRPATNYSLVSQRARFGWGFAMPPGDDLERRVAWNDWKFVCWGLQGEALPDLREAWPLRSLPDGPITVVGIVGVAEANDPVEILGRALPELSLPDKQVNSPGGTFRLIGYETTADALGARQGLLLVSPSSGPSREAAVVKTAELATLSGAFQLEGLIYLPTEGTAALTVNAASRTQVFVNGDLTFDSTGSAPAASYIRLLQGWHIVRITGTIEAGIPLAPTWLLTDGSRISPAQTDFFALADDAVWTHVRTIQFLDQGRPMSIATQRFDFEPHVATVEALATAEAETIRRGVGVSEDRWNAVWHITEADEYTIEIRSPNAATLRVDGRTVAQSGSGSTVTRLRLEPGAHAVEITFSGGQSPVVGGWLKIRNGRGEVITPRVSPF